MRVRFKRGLIEELCSGRKIIFHAGDEAELAIHDVRHLLNRGIREEIKPKKPEPMTPASTPRPETATLPNNKETAMKPKPEGKPTPPKAAQPKAE